MQLFPWPQKLDPLGIEKQPAPGPPKMQVVTSGLGRKVGMYTSPTGHYPVVILNMTKTKHFSISENGEMNPRCEGIFWRLCAFFFQRRKRLKETESSFIIKQEIGRRIDCFAN